MRDPSFFLVWFIMMFGVSLLSSALPPLVGRFLVQSAFARIALVIAVVLSGVALLIGVAYSNEMTPRKAFLLAAGVAPLHQLLLLRYLYGRFIERNGRTPQFVGRSSPQADRTFAVTNILLGAFPYLVLGLIIASLAKLGR
jgi:hypothetical protein